MCVDKRLTSICKSNRAPLATTEQVQRGFQKERTKSVGRRLFAGLLHWLNRLFLLGVNINQNGRESFQNYQNFPSKCQEITGHPPGPC